MGCTYTILGVKSTSMPNPISGGYQPAYETTFKSDHGTIDRVLLPVDQSTPENVANAIQQKCAQIDAIYQLGSG